MPTIRNAFRRSLPVLAGYLVLGAGFGMMMKSAGYGAGWAFAMSLFVYAGSMQYWVAGSVMGALLGEVLPFSTEGVDFTLTALFLTVFTDQWLHSKTHFPALCGVGVSVVCLAVFGPDRFLIPAMAGITALLLTAGLRQKQTVPDKEVPHD